ncbi:hypothetical protein EYF80_023957 [Liparis tanakae]|uniref:Uncharacterized protein n=1 Tax=Liparis tanakae TaxID=230148 RepID=A0A4Z2HKI8_9TELE|nr:hypothetical protein EYF80_023957 [Liparis tanakae]
MGTKTESEPSKPRHYETEKKTTNRVETRERLAQYIGGKTQVYGMMQSGRQEWLRAAHLEVIEVDILDALDQLPFPSHSGEEKQMQRRKKEEGLKPITALISEEAEVNSKERISHQTSGVMERILRSTILI